MPILTNQASRFLGGGRVPPTPVPVAGAELLANPGFTAGATGWTGVLGRVSVASGVATVVPGSAAIVYQNVAAAGGWYLFAFDIVTLAAASFYGRLGNATILSPVGTTTGTLFGTSRSDGVAAGFYMSASADGTIDNVSVKLLSLPSIISVRPYASANCDISVAVTRTAGTQAGFAVRVDDPANPQNFIISYLDGAGSLKTDKCLAGVYTNIAGCSGAITYVAGQRPRIVCAGNDVSVYYNGTQVGSTTAVADAGIVSNKNHGLFSTYAANSFAGYTAA